MGRKTAILAIDEGTSGTRAALVFKDGSTSSVAYESLAVNTPQHAMVEQDADILLAKTIAVCRKTIEEAQQNDVEIAALAISTQRATGVLWDTRTGKALVPAMVWQDSRFAEELKAFTAEWENLLVEKTGRPVGVRSLFLWAARHIQNTATVKEAWEAGRLAFGTIDTWLLWHLSETRRCMTTPTNATSTGAYILADHAYLQPWCEVQGFPITLLPELKQDADMFGYTRKELLGINVPIKASCGDQMAGLIGLGCLDAGQAMCVNGTGSFVDLVIGRSMPARPGLYEATLTMTGRRIDNISHFTVESYDASTGSAVNWICSELGWFKNAEELSTLAASVSSSNGLLFMPALMGMRQPHFLPAGRASLTGLSMSHSRAHLAHAIIEGIAHSIVSCVEACERVAGIPVREIVAGGGLSSSSKLMQIQADLSGIPIRRMPDPQNASLRGAAFLAGSDGLMWDSLADARKTLPEGMLFLPQTDPAERRRRRSRWEALVSEEARRAKAGDYR